MPKLIIRLTPGHVLLYPMSSKSRDTMVMSITINHGYDCHVTSFWTVLTRVMFQPGLNHSTRGGGSLGARPMMNSGHPCRPDIHVHDINSQVRLVSTRDHQRNSAVSPLIVIMARPARHSFVGSPHPLCGGGRQHWREAPTQVTLSAATYYIVWTG